MPGHLLKSILLLIYFSNLNGKAQVLLNDEDYKKLISNCKFIDFKPDLREQNIVNGFRVLYSPFKFRDTYNYYWEAPRGTLTDGASIPEYLQGPIGEPENPKFINASLIHDAYCADVNENINPFWKKKSVADVSRMFYEALIYSHVNLNKAKLMYTGVYLGGPYWEWDDTTKTRILYPLAEHAFKLKRKAIRLQKRWIRKTKPEFWLVELATRYSAKALQSGKLLNEYPSKREIENVKKELESVNKESTGNIVKEAYNYFKNKFEMMIKNTNK